MTGTGFLPLKGEYHDNFLTAQASARGNLDREKQKSLFDRLDWLDALHRIALRNRQPMLLRAHDDDADLWLPLMETGGGEYQALANWYNFTWRPIFGGAYDEVTRLALLRQVALRSQERARRLIVSPVPDEDGSASLLATAFEQAGWHVRMEQSDENHYLSVAGRSFDEYWQGRSSQLRNTVKRKGKKGVVSIRIESQFTEDGWRDYERVYAHSWKPHEGSPEFLRQLARQEGAAGCLRLGLAYIGGQPVAAQFWTTENGNALIHKLAYDERHNSASPGTLLTVAMFQYAIDNDRVLEIDYGTGSDSYKSEWMESVRPRYRLEMLWPNHPLNWPRILRNMIRK
jgi:hypothetical protein